MRLSRSRRSTIVARGLLLVVSLSIGLAVVAGGRSSQLAAPSRATPTVDPRLILRPRTAPVAAVLSPRWPLTGTLYPAYPGRNTLRLRLESPDQAALARSSISLEVTMPGMAMPPIRVVLHGQGGRASGVLTLPMFGVYRAQVVVVTPSGRATGVLALPLSLPRW